MSNKESDFDLILLEKGLLSDIKKLEISKLEKEIELEKIKQSSKKEPIQKGILIALVGLIATLMATIASGIYARIVERDKFESNLIINAVQKENVKDRIEELEFLISANLLTNKKYENINLMLNAENEQKPLLLREFEDANYSNINGPFSLKTKFDKFTYSIEDDFLIIELNGLQFAQLQPRGNNHEKTTITKIVAGITYEINSEGEWDVFSESEPHIINKEILIGEKYEISNIKFNIDISETEQEVNFKIVLFVYEYSGNDNYSEGYSLINIAPFENN